MGIGLPGGHICSRCMAGAVGTGLLLAILVPGAWRELCARGCRATIVVPGVWRYLKVRGCWVAMLVPGAWQEL